MSKWIEAEKDGRPVFLNLDHIKFIKPTMDLMGGVAKVGDEVFLIDAPYSALHDALFVDKIFDGVE